MEVIFGRTVLPMVEGQIRRTVALILADVVGAHGERQLTDVFIAPE